MSETLMTEAVAQTNEDPALSSPAAANTEAGQPALVETSAPSQPAPEGQPEATAPVKADSAPEAYADFAMPEGISMDPSAMASFSAVAKELNLSQEAAQTMIDKMAPAMASRQQELLTQARTDWATAARSDKEYGGVKLSENLAVAQTAMDAFGTPELRALLNESGLGNHPEVIRVFYRAGKAISQDRFVSANGSPQGRPVDPADRLFPNQS